MSQTKQAREWLRKELGGVAMEPSFVSNKYGAALSEWFGLGYGEVDRVILDVCRQLRGGEQSGVDKFAWLRFLAAYPGKLHEHELRAGIAIFEKCNDAIGLAWPSQASLAAAMGGVDPRAVREGISRLVARGLLQRGRIADLSKEEQSHMKRHGRGAYYALRLPSTVEIRRSSEPKNLLIGKLKKKARPDGGGPLQPDGGGPLQPDGGGPSNILGKALRDHSGADAPIPFSQFSNTNRDVSSVEPLLRAPTGEREE